MKEPVKVLIEPIRTVWQGLTEQANTANLIIKLLTNSIKTPYYLNKLSESSIICDKTQLLELKELSYESLKLQQASSLILSQNIESILYPFLVSYWAVVECAFDDLMINLIMNDKHLNQKLKKIGIEMPLQPEVGTTSWANVVYKKLKSRINNKAVSEEKSSVFKNQYSLLKTFEINLEFDKNKVAQIEMYNQIRNCILHNQGIIDNKAANICPELTSVIGQKIKIDNEIFTKCVDSVRDYTFSWITALIHSPFLIDAVKKDSKNPFSI